MNLFVLKSNLNYRQIQSFYKAIRVAGGTLRFSQILSQGSLLMPNNLSLLKQTHIKFSLLQYVQEWQIFKFLTQYQQFPLLNQISHIKFCKLQTLYLNNNFIRNIQALAWLQAPELQLISLLKNKLNSLQPLRKLNAKKLSFVIFDQNDTLNLSEFSHFSRANINKDKFSQFSLKASSVEISHFKTSVCSMIVKFPFQFCQSLIIESKILNIKLLQKVVERFLEMNSYFQDQSFLYDINWIQQTQQYNINKIQRIQ